MSKIYFNFPSQVDLGSYTDAINSYTEKVLRDPGVVSVYQIGNISDPGISDIDMVLVIDEYKLKQRPQYFSIRRLDPAIRYMFMHEPFVISRELFSNLFQIFSVFNLEHIAGEILPLPVKTSELDTAVRLSHLCIASLCCEFVNFFFEKEYNARLTLARLKALKYPYMLHQELTKDNRSLSDFMPFFQSVVDLRSKWFLLAKSEKTKTLSHLIKIAESLSRRLFIKIDGFLSKKYLSQTEIYLPAIAGSYSGSTIPIKIGDIQTPQEPTMGPFEAIYLMEYTRVGGIVGRHIKKHLNLRAAGKMPELKPDYRQAVHLHASLLNRFITFRLKLGFWYGGGYEFGLRPPIKHRLMNRLNALMERKRGRLT